MTGVARELTVEGNIGAVEESLAVADFGDYLGSAEIDAPDRLKPFEVDDAEGIIQ